MSISAIVTGGTKGIGFAIARAIVADGGRVMITGRDRGRVDRAVAELNTGGGNRAAGAAVDVRDRRAVDALVADTLAKFGSINTLVNNAGIGQFAEVASMADEDWHAMIDTNLTGVFYCCRAALPALKQARPSWIINIASLAARNYFAKAACYCASKAGLVAFSEALMLEVRSDDVRVSCVMPGSVATEFGGHAVTAAEAWKLTPEDIAEVVMDLLHHPARSLPSKIEIRPSKTS